MKYYENLIDKECVNNADNEKAIIGIFEQTRKDYNKNKKMRNENDKGGDKQKIVQNIKENFELECVQICASMNEATNYLVKYIYGNKKESLKALLWLLLGKYIYKNILKNKDNIAYFPIEDIDGDIEYLKKYYSREKINIV